MTRHTARLAAALCACASAPPPVVAPRPAPPREAAPLRPHASLRPPGLRGHIEELRALRDIPASDAAVPPAARGPLRALRQGLRAWLLEMVSEAGRVPSRVRLRATLDEAELTASRVGEELHWGAVTRIDVAAPSESLTAVVVGLRLSCTSDDALYVFDGSRLVMELAQDSWESLTEARGDLRVTQSRAARNEGALMVSSRSLRCGERFQAVRFEGIVPGADPSRPASRWDLRHAVDSTGECGGFDEATLGVMLSRNGFELVGCDAPAGGGAPRARRERYAFTREGVERSAEPTSRRSRRN